uniref:Hint domain-containing protein n=3 Tax=viral metagenome TaxID=1070528 RepID=A0A6M3KVK5_9ZZZZ
MEVIEREIFYPHRGWVKLFGIGDIHGGSIHTAEDKIKSKIDEIRCERNAYIVGVGDFCLPLDAEILTKDGFKKYSDLSIGEAVLGFDGEHLIWSPLEAVFVNPELPMLELKSRSFQMICSPNHQWLVNYEHHPKIQKIATRDLKKHHRLVITAECNDEGELDITPKEASLIGWIVTDGNIRDRTYFNKQYQKRYKMGMVASIIQAKEPYRSEIREEFNDWITREYVRRIGKSKLIPNPDCEISNFNIKVATIRLILSKLGIKQANELKLILPSIATRLRPNARRAMLKAMLKAEGWLNGSENWVFSQKPNQVLEAFKILATLEGFRLSIGKDNKSGVRQIVLMSRPSVDVNDLDIQQATPRPAWCPQTKTGSWVTKWRNQICITGNCDCIIKDDPRFDMNGLAGWVERDNIIESQRKWIVNLLKPVRNKILCLLSGNHEEQIHLRSQNDIMRNICKDLDVPWGGYSCFIELLLKPKGGTASYRYVIHAFHGAGAAITEGARLMRLKKLIDNIDADVYFMGHLHSMTSYLPERLALKNHKIKNTHKIAVTTGSWLTSFTQGVTPSYAEVKGYPPSQIGCPCVTIYPDTGRLKVEMP